VRVWFTQSVPLTTGAFVTFAADIPEGIRCDEVENLELELEAGQDLLLDLGQNCHYPGLAMRISAVG
jgi:hypothetical protein